MVEAEVEEPLIDGDEGYEVDTVNMLYERNRWQLVGLTCASGGLQLVWSTVFARGTSYLISLDFSKALVSIAWVAGPCCGAVVQPFFGSLIQRTRYNTRSLLLCGAITTCICLLGFSTVNEQASIVTKWSENETTWQNYRSIFALTWIWALNLSIQPFQIACRFVAVESCPKSQQTQAAAWSGRVSAVGSMLGYFLSAVDLQYIAVLRPWTPFQNLCAVVSFLVMPAVLITCSAIPPSGVSRRHTGAKGNIAPMLITSLTAEVATMPKHIKNILVIQFFAWMGWFPVIYYHNRYIFEIASNSHLMPMNKDQSPQRQAALAEKWTESASLGSLGFALMSFAASVVLPWTLNILTGPYATLKKSNDRSVSKRMLNSSLISLWILGNACFAVITFVTFCVRTQDQGIILVSAFGFSWAITSWIPHALIGQEAARRRNTSGVVLITLHNAFISAPQIVAAVVCSAVFEASKQIGYNDGVVLSLRLSGLSGLAAAFFCLRLRTAAVSAPYY